MANSVNTNAGALVALSSLRGNTGGLNRISKQVETGYRVADASDDAAVFAVAQGVRGNVKAYASVQSSLSAGVGLGEVTLAALKGIDDLVADLKSKIISLADGSLTAQQQDVYRNDATAMIGQIKQYMEQADYNGQNLLINTTNPTNGATPLSFVADVNGTTLDYNIYTHLVADAEYNLAGGPHVWADNGNQMVHQLAEDPPDTVTALSQLESFSSAVTSVSRDVSAQQRRMVQQKGFIDNLVDAMKAGLGALVDADVAAESAALESAKVAQQLSIQSLSIAGQQPTVLLRLLR